MEDTEPFPCFGEEAQLNWGCQPSDISDPMLRGVFDYWVAKRGSRRFPSRRDIDPAELKFALGNIALIEVHSPGPRFRYRLIGSNLVERDGRDMTGLWVDENPSPEYRAMMVERLALVMRRGEPLLVRNRAVLDDRGFRYEIIWLPLSSNDRDIDVILGCLRHHDWAEDAAT